MLRANLQASSTPSGFQNVYMVMNSTQMKAYPTISGARSITLNGDSSAQGVYMKFSDGASAEWVGGDAAFPASAVGQDATFTFQHDIDYAEFYTSQGRYNNISFS